VRLPTSCYLTDISSIPEPHCSATNPTPPHPNLADTTPPHPSFPTTITVITPLPITKITQTPLNNNIIRHPRQKTLNSYIRIPSGRLASGQLSFFRDGVVVLFLKGKMTSCSKLPNNVRGFLQSSVFQSENQANEASERRFFYVCDCAKEMCRHGGGEIL
jgi:hypothetical protein